VQRLYRTAENRDADFDGAAPDDEVVASAFTAWRTEIAYADEFLDTIDDLGHQGPEGDAVREVLVHMIEEYARHNGHADLLRERIDGRIGQ
jgi:hypothetical protein